MRVVSTLSALFDIFKTNLARLILYYPISSLVTLFANILQNPQDARARSDIKLMNSVVGFLTMLSADESNGHVRRMLMVCSEFERISKVALDRAESEFKGRGKRKQAEKDTDPNLDKSIEQQQLETQASYRRPVFTPSLRAQSMSSVSPLTTNQDLQQARTPDKGLGFSPQQSMPFNPTSAGQMPPMSTGMSPGPLFGDLSNSANPNFFGADTSSFSSAAMPNSGFNMTDYPFGNGDIGAGGSFQQPFVPQDLWQMPMTLEWDWANVDAMGMGAFGFDDSQLPNGGQQNQ